MYIVVLHGSKISVKFEYQINEVSNKKGHEKKVENNSEKINCTHSI